MTQSPKDPLMPCPAGMQGHGHVLFWDLDTDLVVGASTGDDGPWVANDIIGSALPVVLGRPLAHEARNTIDPLRMRRETYVEDPVEMSGNVFRASTERSGRYGAFMLEPLEGIGIGARSGFAELDILTRPNAAQSVEQVVGAMLRHMSFVLGYNTMAHVVVQGSKARVAQRYETETSIQLAADFTAPAFSHAPYQGLRMIGDVHAPMITLEGGGWDLHGFSGVLDVEAQVLVDANARSLLAMSLSPSETAGLQHWIYCLHPEPRLIHGPLRRVLRHAAQHVSTRMSHLEAEARAHMVSQGTRIMRTLSAEADPKRRSWRPPAEDFEGLQMLLDVDGLGCLLGGSWSQFGSVNLRPNDHAIFRHAPPSGGVLATGAALEDTPDLAALFSPPPQSLLLSHAPECTLLALRNTPRGFGRTTWTQDEIDFFGAMHRMLCEVQSRGRFLRTNQRQKLLIHELNHRVRNILSIVRSLINQTSGNSDDLSSYTETLSGRIASISKTHDLIVGDFRGSASMLRIIGNEAKALGMDAERVVVAGDDATLPSDQAVAFALVIHELMTNAVKYGSLSDAEGWLRVDLTNSDTGLSLTWHELGGPEPNSDPKGGFGTKLISSIVPVQLNGHLAIDYAPTGLHISLTLPADPLPDEEIEKRTPVAAQPRSVFAQSCAMNDGVGDAPYRQVSSRTMGMRELPAPVARFDLASAPKTPLCMILEDEILVAMDTKRIVEADYAIPCVVVATEDDAMRAIKEKQIDFAILDINLGRKGNSARVGVELMQRGIPFVFLSGYGLAADLPRNFDSIARLTKPLDHMVLKSYLLDWFPSDSDHLGEARRH
ncbi:MAG: hypothetical protein MK098_08595 [Marinovum sp.]|nr:hypothetical protein [Marinovum sp.]